MTDQTPTLIVLSGLPGVGKTTLARSLSERIGAIHVRIDTIEAAMTASGIIDRAGGWGAVPDVGYRIAYAVASDLLAAGHDVVADSVNPIALTRRAWADVARAAGAFHIDVEVICSDKDVHRGRVEQRSADLEGLVVPTWRQVEERPYEPWGPDMLRIDTSAGTERATESLVAVLRGLNS